MGGSPVDETAVTTFDRLFEINLKTTVLVSKHAPPRLRQREGTRERLRTIRTQERRW